MQMSSDDTGGCMAAWKRTVVSVLTSLGAGAALAAWRERRRRRLVTAPSAAPPEPPSGPPAVAEAPPADPAHPGDTSAAIDAARERLRRRADEQRRAAGEGDGPSPQA
jgi:hypothetical protein